MDIDTSKLNEKAQKLVEIARNNNYVAQSYSGEAPRVVILTTTHDSIGPHQSDQLVQIFDQYLDNNLIDRIRIAIAVIFKRTIVLYGETTLNEQTTK